MSNNQSKIRPISILEFSNLNWKQIDNLSRDNTIFFLPISPMEEHGPHLPVGTDFLTATDVAKDVIKQLIKTDKGITGVLFPSVPIGFCQFNTDFPGSISVSSRVVREVIISFGTALFNHGFKMMVICTYHMAISHLKGIYQAMHYLKKKKKMRICEPWSPFFYSDMIEKQEPKLGFDTKKELHGGFRETSMMKYQYPYLVDSSYKELQSIYRNLSSPKIIGKTFKQLGLKEGYVGSPARADADYGRWYYNLIVDIYVQATIDLFENKPCTDLPRHVKTKMKFLFWQ